MLMCLLAAAPMTGCTTVRETFNYQRADQVWTALVAVARTPDYSSDNPDERWFVKENQVWLDPENSRIEIYRELDRVLHRARTAPLREHRRWLFRITLEGTTPPRAEFISRGWGVPMKAKIEGERYFADVWEMLGGKPDIESTATAPEAASEASPPPVPSPPDSQEKPFVDIEELEPTGG